MDLLNEVFYSIARLPSFIFFETFRWEPDVSRQLPSVQSFPYVYEKIFKYLDVESLRNASLVCHDWNDLIAEMSSIMETICLNVKPYAFAHETKNEMFRTIEKSNRNFKAVKIRNFFSADKRIVEVLEMFKWKTIILDSQFIEFPTIAKNCLENLTRLEFQTLELKFVAKILQSTPSLKHLKLILKFCNEYDWNFMLNTSFKLETLTLRLSSYINSKALNIAGFLKTQAASLKVLDFQRVFYNRELLGAMSKLPKLEKLSSQGSFFNIPDDFAFQLKPLRTLKFNELSTRSIEKLVKASPNLRKLEVMNLNQDQIDILGLCSSSLQEIQTQYISFDDISNPALFPALQVIRVRAAINLDVQNSIWTEVHKNVTNFNLCLFEEMSRSPHVHVMN